MKFVRPMFIKNFIVFILFFATLAKAQTNDDSGFDVMESLQEQLLKNLIVPKGEETPSLEPYVNIIGQDNTVDGFQFKGEFSLQLKFKDNAKSILFSLAHLESENNKTPEDSNSIVSLSDFNYVVSNLSNKIFIAEFKKKNFWDDIEGEIKIKKVNSSGKLVDSKITMKVDSKKLGLKTIELSSVKMTLHLPKMDEDNLTSKTSSSQPTPTSMPQPMATPAPSVGSVNLNNGEDLFKLFVQCAGQTKVLNLYTGEMELRPIEKCEFNLEGDYPSFSYQEAKSNILK